MVSNGSQRSNITFPQYLSVASMNCRGLADNAKRRDVLHYLKNKQYSIYCLQDVHWVERMEDQIRAEWGLECFLALLKVMLEVWPFYLIIISSIRF